MTTIAAPVMDPITPAQPRPAPGIFALLPASILVFLIPRLSRSWVRVSLCRAGVVAACNTACGGLWAAGIFLAAHVWRDYKVLKIQFGSIWRLEAFGSAAQSLRYTVQSEWHAIAPLDRSALCAGILFLILGAFLLPFFVILPFGTRPGRNQACLRHVARTVLLGSGLVHWWGGAYVAILLAYAHGRVPGLIDDYARAVTPLLLAFFILSVWTLLVLGYAVRHDYRRPADLPEAHDPWCDDCGYILTGIDPAGRCPECGRPIADSLGPQNRPATAWENRPSLWNLRAIGFQVGAIVSRPRALFFAMPTLTGQAAARRWLLASAIVLFILALPIVPALYVALQAEWNFALVAGALAMGLAWAVFGLMMVGIETAGIATYSRMHGRKVYLSTASKVTSYSALLMIPWILLGGIQLVTYTYFASLPGNGFRTLFHLGLRGEQIALALSLAVAHIGGLLWYELTVYRGIRAIQYANK